MPRSDRRSRGGQRRDVRPRAVVVVVVRRAARLLGAERDEHDREPGAPPGDRLGDGEQRADARRVVLGARARSAPCRGARRPRATARPATDVAPGRDDVDRVAGLDRQSLGRPCHGEPGRARGSDCRAHLPAQLGEPALDPVRRLEVRRRGARARADRRPRGGGPRPSRWRPGRRRGRRARAPGRVGCCRVVGGSVGRRGRRRARQSSAGVPGAGSFVPCSRGEQSRAHHAARTSSHVPTVVRSERNPPGSGTRGRPSSVEPCEQS